MRYKVKVAYDGSEYNGWQRQDDVKTVQEEIEKVLSYICNSKISIVASGRTDAGVHAYGQVFHFDTDLHMTEEKWIHAIHGYLPKDIRIQSVDIVNEDFHARFSAIGKRYDYYLSTNRSNPFIQRYQTIVTFPIDFSKVVKCATLFIGTHDFTSFCSSRIHPDKSRIKRIDRLEVIEVEEGYHFIFKGDGFLRYMIRMITQTLLEVGRGRISINEVEDMLKYPDKDKCRYKAAPNGLYLVDVLYEEEENEKDELPYTYT